MRRLSAAELENKSLLVFDSVLIAATTLALIWSLFAARLGQGVLETFILAGLSFLGLIPVIISAGKSLIHRRLSVDLLASIALIFSLIAEQWSSAAFITLMLAFARLFDRVTAGRARRVIQSLMKYHVERVRIQTSLSGGSVKEVHISQVKPGDLVVVDAGDRMPVDGTVISGTAEADESSLTGESELVPKKAGDKVYTATVSESGSLIVRAEKVGADTTLSHIIKLIEEASRDKSRAEQAAERFTQWYILATLAAAIAMYLYGLSPSVILSVLLVVCADDIAVAVPLAFTAAIARGAKRGVIVKGSAAFEQISRMRYVLTDKTGTLTRGQPKVVAIKAYAPWSEAQVLTRAAMGASESKHAVARAILDDARKKAIAPHAPQGLKEIPGRGISFMHSGDTMFLGRLSLLEHEKIRVTDQLKQDIETQKDAGRGITLLSVNGEAAGLISYQDELRPHARQIIAETKRFGVREWHMLTGDNERAAAAIAQELGIRHYHANMTPEGKVELLRTFEREHKPEIVGYIGDGVNDAASLALADVSIAMGGIGADAAIEAADITIMKDQLDRLPETMGIARKAMAIMRESFWIWGITNAFGLLWVSAGIPGLGILGPAGAAAFNFLTDFIPIGNALRAGRGSKKGF